MINCYLLHYLKTLFKKHYLKNIILLTNNPLRVCKNSATIIVTFLLTKFLTIFFGVLQIHRPPTTNYRPIDRSSADSLTTDHRPTDKSSTDPPTGLTPTHQHRTPIHRSTDPPTILEPTHQPPILKQFQSLYL